jgi:Glycosyltransferase family 87
LSRVSGRAWLLAAGTCVIGIGLVVAAAERSARSASSPIDAPGAWATALAAGIALSFVGYVAGAGTLRRHAASLAAVLAVAAAVQLAPLAGPTLLSTDVWTYWMYGRVSTEHGGNPYGDPPSTYPDDVAFAVMGASWRDTTSLYGPLFTLGSEAHAGAAGDDPGRAAWLYRATSALAVLATAALAASIARRRAFAAAFVGWNPLLALHFGGGGHNDALMMLLVVGALAITARGSPNLAGLAWAAAVGVKWVAAAFLLLWAIDRLRRRAPLGVPGLAAGALVVVLAATLRYGTTWLEAFQGLSSQARRTGSIGLSSWLGDLGLGHRATLVVIAIATLLAFAWLALDAWRQQARLGVAGSVAALGQGWLNPWYASWGVSLAAGEEDRLAWALAVGLTGFLLLDVVPR